MGKRRVDSSWKAQVARIYICLWFSEAHYNLVKCGFIFYLA